MASTSSATYYFITRCLSLSKAHYFYCIKIRALYRTSLMFLWELKNAIISQNLRELCVIKANTNIPHIVASTSSAAYYFITRCLSLSKAHYFYCIKIRVLSRTSMMFLWELKNGIISTTLRGLCDIKTNIKSTHSGFDKLSTKSFITRCLSLSKAHYFYCIKIRALYRTSLMFLWELNNAIISQNLRELCVIKANTKIPHIVASTSSATNSFITRCLSLSKAHYFYCIKICALYKTSMMFLWELKNTIILQNLRELCVIKNL